MALKKTFNTSAQSLSGKTVVFTGELSAVTRRQATAIAQELGAKVTTAVSGNTDIVVAGKDAGQKLQKAANNNVRILTEGAFFNVVKKQRAAIKRAAAKQQPGCGC
jgi:DNA ligase (NAD+)